MGNLRASWANGGSWAKPSTALVPEAFGDFPFSVAENVPANHVFDLVARWVERSGAGGHVVLNSDNGSLKEVRSKIGARHAGDGFHLNDASRRNDAAPLSDRAVRHAEPRRELGLRSNRHDGLDEAGATRRHFFLGHADGASITVNFVFQQRIDSDAKYN